ncbi:MAG: zinc ribbon domain-containing protein, partial [Clostridia bacterium]|nr:zinc ribbon domain-containing protein [Clostridia bacterium]
MICKYCGKEIADNSVICPACGKRLVKSSLWSQLYKLNEIPKRYWLCGAALLVSGIVSLLSFLLLLKDEAYTLKENVITFEQDGESTVFYFDDWELDSEDGVMVDEERMSTSFSGNTFAFFDANSVEQGGDGSVYSVATLYYANNKGVHKVADKVRDFRLSPWGKYIVYVDSVQELQLYDCQKQTEVEIDHNVLINNLCVADDGSIIYLKKESDGEYMFIYRGGKSTEYGETDREPISVTDGGKRFYMTDSADNLYYFNGTTEIKVAADVSACWLDDKGTDIFYHSDGKSYIYTGSGDPHELSEDALSLVLCDNTALYVSDGIVHYGITEFSKKYYTDSD